MTSRNEILGAKKVECRESVLFVKWNVTTREGHVYYLVVSGRRGSQQKFVLSNDGLCFGVLELKLRESEK